MDAKKGISLALGGPAFSRTSGPTRLWAPWAPASQLPERPPSGMRQRDEKEWSASGFDACRASYLASGRRRRGGAAVAGASFALGLASLPRTASKQAPAEV
eukprot:2213515-Prymnesium_polylepis.1